MRIKNDTVGHNVFGCVADTTFHNVFLVLYKLFFFPYSIIVLFILYAANYCEVKVFIIYPLFWPYNL